MRKISGYIIVIKARSPCAKLYVYNVRNINLWYQRLVLLWLINRLCLSLPFIWHFLLCSVNILASPSHSGCTTV